MMSDSISDNHEDFSADGATRFSGTSRVVLVLMIAALILGVVWALHYGYERSAPQYKLFVGDEFPNFTVCDLSGTTVMIHDAYGTGRHILVIGKGSCSHCRAEMLMLASIFSNKDQLPAPIIAVIDPDGIAADKIERTMGLSRLAFPILLDSNKNLRQHFPAARVPSIYFMENNQVKKIIVGERSASYLRQEITNFAATGY